MGTQRRKSLPRALVAGRARFEGWRRGRGPGRRIPDSLWQLAVELAVEWGVHRTAKALRLNYDSLKARVRLSQAENASVESPAKFVELFPEKAPGGRKCSVEFEDGRGARMRIDFEEADATVLGALAGAFVRGGR